MGICFKTNLFLWLFLFSNHLHLTRFPITKLKRARIFARYISFNNYFYTLIVWIKYTTCNCSPIYYIYSNRPWLVSIIKKYAKFC
jgi:hypothetical protein